MIKKIIKFIKDYLKFDRIYQLTIMGTSLSFYSMISVSSFAVIMISFLVYTNDLFTSFLINDIINIIGNTFKGLLSEVIDKITISGFSIFLIISIVFSVSSYINKLTMFTDIIYIDFEKRNYIKSRFNGALLFIMFMFILFGELSVIIYSKYLLNNIFNINSIILNNLITLCFELFIIYVFILILNIYLPPLKIYIKDVWLTSGIVTLAIYILLFIFKMIFHIISKISFFNTIIYTFVVTSFLLFSINYLLILGIIIIYQIKYNKYLNYN